jgi:hypothetical protein
MAVGGLFGCLLESPSSVNNSLGTSDMAEMERLVKPALAVYRRMLRLAKRLPASERESTAAKIRAAFRENKSETSSERCESALRVVGSQERVHHNTLTSRPSGAGYETC